MLAIDYVIRDGAGRLVRGTVGDVGGSNVLLVDTSSEVSLNLLRADVYEYKRLGTALEITLMDGRVLMLDGFFSEGTVTESRLYLSAEGELVEITFSESWGRTNYAHFDEAARTASEDELLFITSSGVVTETEATMAAFPLFLGGGWGTAGAAGAAAAGGALLLSGGGGDDGPTNSVTSPADPASVDNPALTITGTAVAGSTVYVTVGDQTLEAQPDADGNWAVTFEGDTLPSDGNYGTTVRIVEGNGDETELTGPDAIIDTVAPTLDVTSGVISTGDIIDANWQDGGAQISGTSEPGATIIITVNGTEQKSIANADGNWYVNLPENVVPEGTYQLPITVTARDAAGNEVSVDEVLNVDTVGNQLGLANSSVAIDDVINDAENDAGVSVSGTATPGVTVNVTLAGVAIATVADASGAWTAAFDPGALSAGEYDAQLVATTTDGSGNTTTDTKDVRIDTEVTGFKVTSSEHSGDPLGQQELAAGVTVEGTTEPGSTVTVTIAGVGRPATVATDGTWTVTFPDGSLPSGDYTTTMTAETIDPAGNPKTIVQPVDVDTIAGLLTISGEPLEGDDIINDAEAADGVTIRGTADPDAVVEVTFGRTSKTVVAEADGTWQAYYSDTEIPADTDDAPISAYTEDSAGNRSEVTDSVQIDTVVTDFEMSDEPIAGDDLISSPEAEEGVLISGMVEDGSSVEVTLGGQTVDAIVVSGGAWTATFTETDIAVGEMLASLVVTATDAAGNETVFNDSVQIDTEVSTLTITTLPVSDGRILNAAGTDAGITIGGRVEAGSTVLVTFEGTSLDATVSSTGSWTVNFTSDDIPSGEYTADVTVFATDEHGNTDTVTAEFAVDNLTPGAPIVTAFSTGQTGLRGISAMLNDNDVDITEITDRGALQNINYTTTDDVVLGETSYRFTTPVSDGSDLVVTAQDGAGNSSSSLFVLENENDPVVNLQNSGLSNFNIEMIDLQFASDADVVLTASLVRSLSDHSDVLTIHGGADDHVTMTGAQRTGQVEQIGTHTYDVYTLADAGGSSTIIIDKDIEVVI